MKVAFAGLQIDSPQFADALAASLQQVEDLLIGELSSGEDFLTEAATHLAKAGGKRFRPVFALLSAEFGPEPHSSDVITSATVVELIHLATLYHDDVMDEADMRRGAQSANSRWTNSIAILAGDFLFARASRLVSTLGPQAVLIIAETFAELVTGQMRETVGSQDKLGPVDHYLQVIWEKTGSLIAAAGRFGAMASGAQPEVIESLYRLGADIGMAFQISDDIIDIASVSDDSGKTPGTDLREGVHTLPVLYALDEQGADADRLRQLLVADGAPIALGDDDAAVAEALELLNRSSGMAQAKEMVQRYADKADAELAQLAPGDAHDALSSLVRFTVQRVG